jgi:hypothetical protein
VSGCVQMPIWMHSSHPAIRRSVNLSPQKVLSCSSVIVNELGCGIEVGDHLRKSREACAVRSRLDPGGDGVKGSSSVVVRLAPTSPPSPSREEPSAPGSGTGHFRRNSRRGRHAERAIMEASSSLARRVDDRRACTAVSRDFRWSIQLH